MTPMEEHEASIPLLQGFLNFSAVGCNVVVRYPNNPDTKFIELMTQWPSIDSNEQFQTYLLAVLEAPIAMEKSNAFFVETRPWSGYQFLDPLSSKFAAGPHTTCATY